MKVKQFVFNHFQENCFVIYTEDTKQCAIVDPGANNGAEQQQLEQFIARLGLTPTLVLLTHAHIDHIAGLRHACTRYGLPATLHADGAKLLHQSEAYAEMLGFATGSLEDIPTRFIDDNEVLQLGNEQIECRFTPGHCEGSMSYVLHGEQIVITGDLLFRGSIGRTDLPGGNYDLLMDKLRSRVMTLPDEYEVLPGHGDISTIGEEHMYNGFLQD